MKIPVITELTDVELIRDGGSMLARVTDEQGNQYILFIQIVLRETEGEVWRRVSYLEPCLKHSDGKYTMSIDWGYCAEILELPNNIKNENRLSWLSEMKAITKCFGQAPKGKVLSGPWRKHKL